MYQAPSSNCGRFEMEHLYMYLNVDQCCANKVAFPIQSQRRVVHSRPHGNDMQAVPFLTAVRVRGPENLACLLFG